MIHAYPFEDKSDTTDIYKKQENVWKLKSFQTSKGNYGCIFLLSLVR